MIKTSAIVIALLMLLAVSYPKPIPAAELNWNTYVRGMELAKSENKKALINFFADWCRYCYKMEMETFRNGAVANYLKENFVLIKVNADRARTLARSYFVRSLPTVWFVGPKGEKLTMARGFIPADRFLEMLKTVHDLKNH